MGAIALGETVIPHHAADMLGTFLNAAEQLGKQAAAMHETLAANQDDPAFAPEPFTSLYQRSLYQYLRNLVGQSLLRLQAAHKHLPTDLQPLAHQVIHSQDSILAMLGTILQTKIESMRIRCHGDLGLERVLYTGKDFIFVDFEGDPSRPPSERRLKRSPLRDVAGMVHSFDAVTRAAVNQERTCGAIYQPELGGLSHYASYFSHWSSVAFWHAYRARAQPSLLPPTTEETRILLTAFSIERAVLAFNAAWRQPRAEVPAKLGAALDRIRVLSQRS
ncbi:MAG: hypothetical protein HC919_02990 [Oscillatoriales cyanobacterium SM2_2_1]|nr:hypothetical protein [Oscillatoriales cyanobacterium SM2_2_1]